MRFSIEPLPGKNGYQQWYDALKAVVRLPRGIPHEFRRQIWLCLADNHIRSIKVDWEKTVKLAFNERSNPDDDKLGIQIVKDLHRTGCSGFCGQEAEEDRVVLKRVLLAYARWNKAVGYCQGFNVLAALILEVMQRKEDDALKMMIYLIDHVLPESYFANNLRALSVDMAVFRQLLQIKLPQLSKHLDNLQKAANDDANGHYEPPLTNVFTMQWFLTLFATCLPKPIVLRVWDCVFLEGSEILLRTALAIWAKLGDRIEGCQSADDFYTSMGFLTHEMLHIGLVSGDELIQTIYNMAPFPFPHLDEIREKFMYSITPFTPVGTLEKSVKNKEKPRRSVTSDEEIDLDEDDLQAINCFGVFMPPSPQRKLENGEIGSSNDITNVSPGAFSSSSDMSFSQKISSSMLERMSLDIYSLKRQYWRIQERQQQAHVIYGSGSSVKPTDTQVDARPKMVRKNITPHIEKPPVMNHLFVGKKGLGARNKRVTIGPRIASPTQNHASAVNHLRIRAHVNAHVAKTIATSPQSSSSDNSPAEDKESPVDIATNEKVTNGMDENETGSEVAMTENVERSSSSGDDQTNLDQDCSSDDSNELDTSVENNSGIEKVENNTEVSEETTAAEPKLAVLIDLEGINDDMKKKTSQSNKFHFDVTSIAAKLTEEATKTNGKPKQINSQEDAKPNDRPRLLDLSRQTNGKSAANELDQKQQHVRKGSHHNGRIHHHTLRTHHKHNQQYRTPRQVHQHHPHHRHSQEFKDKKPMTLLEMATQATTVSAHRSGSIDTSSESQHPNETAVLPVQTVEERIATFSLKDKKKRTRSKSTEQLISPTSPSESNSKSKSFNPFPQRQLKSGLSQAKCGNKFGLYNGNNPKDRSLISQADSLQIS
ncbi:TBC1 domain family member 30-like [Saccoglossus kowalevskii]|uniref:TBC1 domain family member 30-like n=1 Tax=Saccoglossus kowalevskii TaxID=10224 RepID=A0ABM0MG95_SACKO|nr:PREDICTED: TBC1 domain family member 30-like [Saccoglossus kowalevskii]